MLHVTMMVPRPSEPFKLATQHRLAFSAAFSAISVGVFLGRANVFAREYFYSPQSSSVVKSKMAATTIRTQ